MKEVGLVVTLVVREHLALPLKVGNKEYVCM